MNTPKSLPSYKSFPNPSVLKPPNPLYSCDTF